MTRRTAPRAGRGTVHSYAESLSQHQEHRMPAKPRYNKGRVDVRLDEASQKALNDLIRYTGKTESKLIREALIEKAAKDVPTETQPGSNKTAT